MHFHGLLTRLNGVTVGPPSAPDVLAILNLGSREKKGVQFCIFNKQLLHRGLRSTSFFLHTMSICDIERQMYRPVDVLRVICPHLFDDATSRKRKNRRQRRHARGVLTTEASYSNSRCHKSVDIQSIGVRHTCPSASRSRSKLGNSVVYNNLHEHAEKTRSVLEAAL